MSLLIKLYNNSPVCLQNLFCSMQGFLICRRRYSSNFYKQLKLYEAGYYKPEECLEGFIKNIATVPYYSGLFRMYRLDIEAKDIYAEICKLPILTKDEVKENLDKIVNKGFKGKYTYAKTSGTTGSGLVFPYSRDMENKQWAVWWRYRRWHGIDLNCWMGWFGGRTIMPVTIKKAPFWRINIPGKQVMFSAYHLNQATVKDYYLEIRHRKLTWLHGYPSQLSLLASLILEEGLLPLDDVTHITFGAENLLENQKRIIRRAFPKAVLRQHYGLSEGVANISENKEGELVVDQDFCYVEFVPVSPDKPEVCRIIGTGFNNPVFPLVRYDTGDIAVIERKTDGKIKIKSIDGRQEDFIKLPNGVKLGRLDHIFKELTKVREAQIVQDAIDLLRIRVVKGNGYDEMEENKLWQELRSRIGEEMAIVIDYTDKIERTKSGKLRFVISKLK